MKLLLLVYIAAGLYSMGLLWILLMSLKYHNLPDTYNKLVLKKYPIIIVLVALIATPVNFWISLSHIIPNDEYYTVTVRVECNDGTKFNAKGTIWFFEDVEYYDSGHDGEPLFGLSNGDETVVYRNFYLTDVDCNNKYEVWVNPDEPIDGNKVDATVYYNSYDAVDAEVFLPPLTDKTLGITLADKMAAYSTLGYLEHGLNFVAALVDIILCFIAAIRRRKKTPETP